MRQTYDHIIIGAGPAGSTAARFLARAGSRVLLIEKNKLPRYKVCGGGLVWRARKALELELNGIVEREFNTIHWNFRNGLSFRVDRPYPLVTMVMRDRFDEFLTQEAAGSGADIHDGEKFENFSLQAGNAAVVHTDKGSYNASYILAADGLRSQVLRQLGWDDSRIKIPAIEAELDVSNQELFPDVVFDVGAVRKGYGWIFPKANHLSVGIAAMPGKGHSLRAAYRNYLEQTGIKKYIIREKQYGYQIPLRPLQKLHEGPIFLLGDAAGLADPLVAEGISHAVFSGKLASEAILSAPDNAGQRYQQLIREQLSGQIRAAAWLSRLFYNYPGICERILKSDGDYISSYVSDIFAGERTYPHNPWMFVKSIKRLLMK